MTQALLPCTLNVPAVSGPSGRLDNTSVSYQNTKSRIRACDSQIHAQVQKRGYKNHDKTPTTIKVCGGIALLAGVIYYIKTKFKK